MRNSGTEQAACRLAEMPSMLAVAVRRDRYLIGFRQDGDLLHLRDAAGVAAIRLQHIEAALVQVGDELPDGPVALAGRQRDADRLLDALEHLDVARYGRLLQEEQVVKVAQRQRTGSGSPAAGRSGRRT